MKLNLLSGIAAVSLVLLVGCGTQASQKTAQAPNANGNPNAVGTTQLMAAEVHVTNDEQLKVGKSQHSASPRITDEAVEQDDITTVKDAPRRDDRRRGSGFSGWK